MMQQKVSGTAAALFAVTLGLTGALRPIGLSAAETEDAVTITVASASAKVGEKAVIVATITPRDGYKIADAYRNRLMSLSSADSGVRFDSEVVRATLKDGTLVFKLQTTPLTAGEHAINGVFRFAYVSSEDGAGRLDIKSAPLIATVSGTE